MATHKAKLSNRYSLQKGGSLLASDALARTKKKAREVAAENLKRAQTAVTRAENKWKNQDKKEIGNTNRKAKRERIS